MRRITLLALLLLLAAVASPAPPGLAQPSQPAAVQQPVSVRADFNQDGFSDLAIGAPGEDIGAISGAGAINVLYGTANGLSGTGSQLFTQVGGAIEAGDIFGETLASGDFNHDGFVDLAAGAPGEAVGNLQGAGAVSVLYGSASGLTVTGGRLFTQVGGAVEAGDGFGDALASGDFNRDGFADLAAGAPNEAVGSIGYAGAASVLYGSAGGLTATGGRLFTQVGGTPERDDFFGAALAAGDFNQDGFADLAAGARNEAVGSIGYAGAASVLYGTAGGLTASGGRLFTQVGGAVEAGDFFGWAVAAGDFNQDGFADLAASAPLEGVGTFHSAGAVSILYGSAGGLTTSGGRLFTFNLANGFFGLAVTTGDFNHDSFADLAAGAPGALVGSISEAGVVGILYGSAGGLTATGGRLFTQAGGTVETNDWFGEGLASGDFNQDGFADLAASARREAVGSLSEAGAVSVLNGSTAGVTTTDAQLFTQDSPGVPGASEPYDHFGASLAAGSLGATPAAASPTGASSTARPAQPSR